MTRWEDEQGTITLWVLGICVAALFLGGVSTDLWRAYSLRQTVAGAAESAAAAGAGFLDQAALRQGQVLLDVGAATAAARAALQAHPAAALVDSAHIDAGPTGITVRLASTFELTLLRVLSEQDTLPMSAEASAAPRREG